MTTKNNWKEPIKELGTIKQSKTVKVTFNYIGDKVINSIKASCGCTTTKLENNIITASYTPGKVPNHLKVQGYYLTNKMITVVYEDNTQDILIIKAKVTL